MGVTQDAHWRRAITTRSASSPLGWTLYLRRLPLWTGLYSSDVSRVSVTAWALVSHPVALSKATSTSKMRIRAWRSLPGRGSGRRAPGCW